MDQQLWAQRALPDPGPAPSTVWAATPAGVADLSLHRAGLRDALARAAYPADAGSETLDRVLLAFEELASNGLRHGGPPVRVTVTGTASGWVVDVTDSAVDRPPSPAVDRDPARGGLGLHLVARLACGHGWDVRGGRKHVWACIEFGAGPFLLRPPGTDGGDRPHL